MGEQADVDRCVTCIVKSASGCPAELYSYKYWTVPEDMMGPCMSMIVLIVMQRVQHSVVI